MKIVVLDGYTANPGDLSWESFAALGELQVYDRTPEPEIIPRALEAEIVLTNKTVLTRAHFAALPKLRFVGVLATGYNVVEIEAARERGIPVCNVPEYGTPNVAQAVFALILELTNQTGHHAQTVRAGRWSSCPDFCYWDTPLFELQGRTLGLLGFGRIAQAVAKIGAAFGMQVLCTRRHVGATESEDGGVRSVDRATLIRESDILSLHCPLTPETKGVVNAATLATMKRSAYLINTARGALICEQELADALNQGALAGAGLDVLSTEPPPASNPLLQAKNCVITPHIAWATREARGRLLATAAGNVGAWISGQARNVVNPK
jgi:glycerate dehydrogenase